MKLLKLKEGAEKFLNRQISDLIDFSLENNIEWSNNKYDAEREFHKIVEKEVKELLKTINSKLKDLDLEYKKLEAEEWDFYFKSQEKRKKMFLNYSFENSKGKIKCDVCEKEHLKGLIFNFNMDKNANLRHLLLVEKYGGIVEFKPLCIGCECEMKEPFKIEITHKEISGLFIKARDAK